VQRVALISDIHGNLTALDAVLGDIALRGINRIICLGDLVGKGPRSDATVDRCRDVCEVVLRGNWDDFIGDNKGGQAGAWYQAQLGRERLKYVSDLPLSMDLAVSGQRLRLFHASEESVHVRVLMSAGELRHLAMFNNTELTGLGPTPDLVGYGDIHRAFVMSYRTVSEAGARHQTLFNVGSVGNPLDSSAASYAVIEGEFRDSRSTTGVSIQLVRVSYDIEAELSVARAMDMPNYAAYEQELRAGVYAGALRTM
jgi:predicted phosphodiesterase